MNSTKGAHAAHVAARSRDLAFEELDALFAKIRADEEDLALCAPQRQRLVLLAWIAHARAIQSDFLGDDDVDDVVASIARAIGALTKRWWPGSVPALQQAAVPEDAERVLPDEDEYDPSTWHEVAERAERCVRAIEEVDRRRGFDEFGWADAAACNPPPPRPREMLAKVVAELAELEPDEATANDVGRLVGLAHRLRFLRTSAPDAVAWSTAIGHLRRRAARDRVVFADLARELDPAFTPARSWSVLVGDVAASRKPEVDPALCARPTSVRCSRPPRRGQSRCDASVARGRSAVDRYASREDRRAVFVTNRTDPDLRIRLDEVCEFSELDWVESAPRTIDAVANAIVNRRYDLVIAATGFLDHPVDTKLSHVCRGVGMPYVKANRGRVVACMRALARDLVAS